MEYVQTYFRVISLLISRVIFLWSRLNFKKHVLTYFLKAKDEYGWCTFCFGDDFWNQVIDALQAKDEYDEESDQKLKKKSYANAEKAGYQPLLNILSNLRPTIVSKLIEYHSSWAESIEKVTLGETYFLRATRQITFLFFCRLSLIYSV